jgi:hypothetical protein
VLISRSVRFDQTRYTAGAASDVANVSDVTAAQVFEI